MKAIKFYQSQFCFPVSDDMIITAIGFAGVEATADTELGELSAENKELARAHILRMLALSHLGYTDRVSSSDFGSTNTVKSLSSQQLSSMRAEANRIFKKYNQNDFVIVTNSINVYEDDN